jgi:hypothetical protein
VSLFGGNPRPGDWIVTTEPIKHSLSDYLSANGGIRAGARGVITGRSGWNSIDIRFDGGLFGGYTVRARPSQVRVTRRGAGVDAFAARTARVNAARFGVATAIVAPLLFFTISWFLRGGSKAGLLATLLEGAVNGVADVLAYAISNPIQAIVYLVLLTVAGRFAFG